MRRQFRVASRLLDWAAVPFLPQSWVAIDLCFKIPKYIYIYIYICGCLNKVLPENCQQSSNLTLRKLNDDEWWASQGEKMRWTYHMALYRNGGRSTRILGHSIFKTNPHETPWNQLKHVETAGFYTQPDALQGTKMCPIHGYNCAEWTWMTAFSGPPNNHHGSFQPLLRSLYPCYNDVLPTRYNWGNNCWPVTRVCLYWHMFLYKEATCYILPFWPLESLLPIPIACHSMPQPFDPIGQGTNVELLYCCKDTRRSCMARQRWVPFFTRQWSSRTCRHGEAMVAMGQCQKRDGLNRNGVWTEMVENLGAKLGDLRI